VRLTPAQERVYRFVRDYLQEHYEAVETVDGVRIYRRASCVREGGARTGARP
jgi:hypothetical protein